MAFQSVKGFKDILPPESSRQANFEDIARKILGKHGYREIRLPIVESRELYVKSTGETTDIVEKEMFELEDAGGRKLALRPEGTPGAVRAYLEHHLNQQGAHVKLFYIGSMFRAERPQAGRFREFTQIGAESFGNRHPSEDAELVEILSQILDAGGLKDSFSIHINNIGCERSECRPEFRGRLKAFLGTIKGDLCENCQRRIDRNPLRVLDCKGDGPRLRDSAPKLNPCKECSDHFTLTTKLLGNRTIKTDTSLVRGLDYYTRTVFEFKSEDLGAQDALAGGGRYDNLIESMGGPETPAVGWALGLERIMLAAGKRGGLKDDPPAHVCVVVQSASAPIIESAMRTLERLHLGGATATAAAFDNSLKSQMREAERLNVRYAFVFGEDESKKGGFTRRDMETKEQAFFPYEEGVADTLTALDITPPKNPKDWYYGE